MGRDSNCPPLLNRRDDLGALFYETQRMSWLKVTIPIAQQPPIELVNNLNMSSATRGSTKSLSRVTDSSGECRVCYIISKDNVDGAAHFWAEWRSIRFWIRGSDRVLLQLDPTRRLWKLIDRGYTARKTASWIEEHTRSWRLGKAMDFSFSIHEKSLVF